MRAVQVDAGGRKVAVTVGDEEGTLWACPERRERLPVHDHVERTWRHVDTCQFETVLLGRVPQAAPARWPGVDGAWALGGKGQPRHPALRATGGEGAQSRAHADPGRAMAAAGLGRRAADHGAGLARPPTPAIPPPPPRPWVAGLSGAAWSGWARRAWMRRASGGGRATSRCLWLSTRRRRACWKWPRAAGKPTLHCCSKNCPRARAPKWRRPPST